MVDRMILDYRTERGMQPSANFRLLLISILASIIGIIAGFVAYFLYHLIAFFTNLFFFQRFSLELPNLQLNQLGPWVILVTVVGGLIVGIMAKYGSPKIKGHGIPEAMEAVLVNRSRISPRVALLKPLSAAIAIGTGGPFGAEGPIIQTGGAIGSIFGQILRTTAAERKVLLACGAAAGMAATFSTPIAAVILAIELLLFEFKSRSFIPLVIASTLATSVHFVVMGRGPMVEVGPMDFGVPSGLPFYLILGLLCGLAAVFFSKALYWVEDQFERLPIDPMWWPAIGGIVLGVLGFFVPRILGVGYDTITDILNNRLTLTVLLVIMLCKSLALLATLGSGTSGGLLAPMFMASAAMGASFALLVNAIIPDANLAPGAYALVAMAAVFGAASRATFTFIIFAFEITRDYNAILPLMLVCVLATGIAMFFMRESIMTEKLARRGLYVRQEYETDILQQVTVGEVMNTNTPTVLSTMHLNDLADRISQGDPLLTQRQALPIVDEQDRLVGIITRGDVLRGLADDSIQTVIDAGSDNLVVTYPDESLHEAITKMLRNDIGRLPVVNRSDPQHLVGYLGRSGVIAARRRRFEEEQIREPGWWNRVPLPKQVYNAKSDTTVHSE
ncbi:MAG: chloride channel protein [Chloroflexota bacterium]